MDRSCIAAALRSHSEVALKDSGKVRALVVASLQLVNLVNCSVWEEKLSEIRIYKHSGVGQIAWQQMSSLNRERLKDGDWEVLDKWEQMYGSGHNVG